MQTLVLKDSLVNRTVMFFFCVRNPERTHTCAGRTCKLHADISQAGIQALKGNSAVTAPILQPETLFILPGFYVKAHNGNAEEKLWFLAFLLQIQLQVFGVLYLTVLFDCRYCPLSFAKQLKLC
ncbi:hypothetical protein AMECASPLE_024721 [Ameca splendens]|uniref:Uncharacterized protein n=1 Tax=Ameca splendens TaxID=208324 RepID=A0ABV0ZPB6_9TELE